MTTISLKNSKTTFEINFEAKKIDGADLKDSLNYPVCYNKTTRSIKKAAKALQEAWNDNTTMWDAVNVLTANGVQMRSYCQMD